MNNLLRLVDGAGAHEVEFRDAAFPDRPLMLFSACPRGSRKSTPILFVHHGRSRNGRDYRDYLLEAVDELDLLVIAPEFSLENFPDQPWYNGGNVLNETAGLNPVAQRSHTIIEHLFAALVAQGVGRGPGRGLCQRHGQRSGPS